MYTVMDSLATAYDSSGEEDAAESSELNHTESSAVLESIKKKYALDSAPYVPVRVSTN